MTIQIHLLAPRAYTNHYPSFLCHITMLSLCHYVSAFPVCASVCYQSSVLSLLVLVHVLMFRPAACLRHGFIFGLVSL